ncbi:5-formyltetrahydrofolate cyclo-ligase [Mucilaginibacter sp. Bleaf8]|uniref:5-formyltetrahydrofolate cyclo-ligase n=1 Tax=Mucilaginibacter sp. Bleaf8 TaxID=2834430 RepID=UPI001BCF6A7D|nr:5-formyltetrahydrofolate cyclo-ligase [Mucilaginibacter sp. Bleaf8]
MIKQELRKLYIDKRKQLSQADYEDLNHRLLLQFQQLNLSAVKYIHLFLPIHKRKEPDTFLLRQWLHENHPDIQLVFPKADFATYTMQSFLDDADLKLATNAYGIPEPVTGNLIMPHEIDMVLVPLLAFDERGYRVGYGKGFYDRFLAQCRPDALFIGLSFFEPVHSIEDADELDTRLHLCITPDEIYYFNK